MEWSFKWIKLFWYVPVIFKLLCQKSELNWHKKMPISWALSKKKKGDDKVQRIHNIYEGRIYFIYFIIISAILNNIREYAIEYNDW